MDDGIVLTIISWIIRPFTQPEFWLISLGLWICAGICAVLIFKYKIQPFQEEPTHPGLRGYTIIIAYGLISCWLVILEIRATNDPHTQGEDIY